MKLNEMKIKLGEKIVESPRLLKEEKLEILACIKEEKNSEILDALLHEYEIDKNKLIKKFDKVDSSTELEPGPARGSATGYAIIHFIARRRYKSCMKDASKIKNPQDRQKKIEQCKNSLKTIKNYV